MEGCGVAHGAFCARRNYATEEQHKSCQSGWRYCLQRRKVGEVLQQLQLCLCVAMLGVSLRAKEDV